MARVLVIEDEVMLRSIIRRVLLGASHDVIDVDTARSGLEDACSVPADVVLADICLGERDGIAVMAAIRRAQPGMPLIAVSGRPSEEILERLNAAGLRESVWWLAKPFRAEELVDVVGRASA